MSKQDFVLVDSAVTEVANLLLERIEGFANSEELLRHQEWKSIPGVVCGALATYISRIHLDGDPDAVLESAFSAIESLSSVGDSEIENLIVTEILENINFKNCPELVQRLGPESRAIYDHWLV